VLDAVAGGEEAVRAGDWRGIFLSNLLNDGTIILY
jgi:hypothetical protein